MSQHRRSSTRESLDASRVRFALDENQRTRYNNNHGETESTRFVDPFTGVPAINERRLSELSDASEYLRPNAFARHRDTLARIDLPLNLNTQRRRSSNVFLDEIAQRFLGHRDTLARLRSSQNRGKPVPPKVVKSILESLDFDDYKNLRLTCHQWLDALPRPKTPASSRLPVEVLQQIYGYLQPCDFDSARHTCRSWFLASLNRSVGVQILKKAGCYPAFQLDLERHREALRVNRLVETHQSALNYDNSVIDDCPVEILEDLNEEWLISKRLATEARLSSAWHGSGLSEETAQSTSRFVTTETVHFGKLAVPNKFNNRRTKKFTVSACGKFLLVVVGTDIFVYSMGGEGETLQPRVRLVTGKAVLSVSMDSSSGRYAVAALLEGNLGMSWEMDDLFASTETASIRSEPMSLGLHAEISASNISETRAVIPLSLPDRREEYSHLNDEGNNNEQNIERPSELAETSFLGTDSTPPSLCASPSDQSSIASDDDYFPKSTDPLEALPIISQPTQVYKSLGYSNDGPRSVAVCPQRKCVAFGCRTGIELHWVDAPTGRNLNRWFPLAAPSDFLYFLPPRSDSSSAKKLRLISSSAGPLRRTASRHSSTPKSKFSPSGARHGRRQSMTRLFFGDLPFPSALNGRRDSRPMDEQETQGVMRAVDCDHYHAVPLSDGVHMLYTDPVTGRLCLGSDAPLGGPTKLVRKVCMIPPKSDTIARGSPICYAAAQDLTRGVRIIAAYEDGSLVLYNIPSECFERIRNIRSSPDVWDELSGVMGQSDLLMDGLMVDQNNTNNGIFSTADVPEPGSAMSFRSLQINGAFICHTDADVEDIQLDSSTGGLQFWTFHHSGQAKKMDIYAPGDHDVKSHIVGVDGLLRNAAELSYRQVFDNQPRRRRARKDSKTGHRSESPDQCVKFYGLDGATDYELKSEELSFENELRLLEELNIQSQVLHPDVAITDGQQLPGFGALEKLQVEVLTDWRNTMLLSPYVIHLD